MGDAFLAGESAMIYEQTSGYLSSSHSTVWCLRPKSSKTDIVFTHQLQHKINICSIIQTIKFLMTKITFVCVCVHIHATFFFGKNFRLAVYWVWPSFPYISRSPINFFSFHWPAYVYVVYFYFSSYLQNGKMIKHMLINSK